MRNGEPPRSQVLHGVRSADGGGLPHLRIDQQSDRQVLQRMRDATGRRSEVVRCRPARGGIRSSAGAVAPSATGRTASRLAATGERRLVSVLFADLVGFTPFAEERDAEEIREMLSRYFEIASDVIGRYGGTIEKFIGDAVMAVWGTPVAHEDDAERSVRAALELVDAVQGPRARRSRRAPAS